jgi:hypothetical protein
MPVAGKTGSCLDGTGAVVAKHQPDRLRCLMRAMLSQCLVAKVACIYWFQIGAILTIQRKGPAVGCQHGALKWTQPKRSPALI